MEAFPSSEYQQNQQQQLPQFVPNQYQGQFPQPLNQQMGNMGLNRNVMQNQQGSLQRMTMGMGTLTTSGSQSSLTGLGMRSDSQTSLTGLVLPVYMPHSASQGSLSGIFQLFQTRFSNSMLSSLNLLRVEMVVRVANTFFVLGMVASSSNTSLSSLAKGTPQLPLHTVTSVGNIPGTYQQFGSNPNLQMYMQPVQQPSDVYGNFFFSAIKSFVS